MKPKYIIALIIAFFMSGTASAESCSENPSSPRAVGILKWTNDSELATAIRSGFVDVCPNPNNSGPDYTILFYSRDISSRRIVKRSPGETYIGYDCHQYYLVGAGAMVLKEFREECWTHDDTQ